MDNASILSHVDHTLLKPFSTWANIQILCQEALQYKTAAVCIPPSYIKRCRQNFDKQLNIASVIGFPLGYNESSTKCFEAEKALEDGANELDMVLCIAELKNKNYAGVESEIRAIKDRCGKQILKVIVETCYLTEQEKIVACKLVSNAGADFIKTSTGFGSAGATIQDIKLFKTYIGPGLKIKAAGGIQSREDMVAFLELGCERLGTSSAIKILCGEKAGDY